MNILTTLLLCTMFRFQGHKQYYITVNILNLPQIFILSLVHYIKLTKTIVY